MLQSTTINRIDAARDGMAMIHGGTFRIGSDKHYPEEARVHRVTVDATPSLSTHAPAILVFGAASGDPIIHHKRRVKL